MLVAEGWGKRATERDLGGAIRWQYRSPEPVLACHRLSNGNTAVVSRQRIAEVTPDGKEVVTRAFTTGIVGPRLIIFQSVQCLDTGRVLCIASDVATSQPVESLMEFDLLSGTILNQIPLARPYDFATTVRVEAVAGIGYLLSDGQHRVRAVDAAGQTVRDYPGPDASLLRNANLLRPGQLGVCEQTPDGKLVWEAFGAIHDMPREVHDCLGLVRFGFALRLAGLDLATSEGYRLKRLKSKNPRTRWEAIRTPTGSNAVPLAPALEVRPGINCESRTKGGSTMIKPPRRLFERPTAPQDSKRVRRYPRLDELEPRLVPSVSAIWNDNTGDHLWSTF